MNISKIAKNFSASEISYDIILLTAFTLLASIILWSALGMGYFIVQIYILPNQLVTDTLLMLSKLIQLYFIVSIVKNLPTIKELHLKQ